MRNIVKDRFPQLKKARPISFQRRNKTLQSQKLCSTVCKSILSLEVRRRSRKAKDEKAFALAVELILADLMVSAGNKGSGWAYRSLCNDRFAGELVKAVTFKKVMGLLKLAGYVEHVKGGNCSNPFHIAGGESKPFYPGLASRYRATKDLLAIACSFGIGLGDISSHYYTKLPTNVLKLKAASSRWHATKARGQAMRIKDSIEVLELRNQVRQINQYLSQHTMEGAVFSGYYRSFNMGDDPNFNWDKGGRLYNPGDDSHQRLKKEDRLSSIKINNETACEIDVNASYLCIFYQIVGHPLPKKRDLYRVPGLHRKIVKAWITTAFGKGQFPTRWSVRAKAELTKEGICTAKLTMTEVGRRVCKAIPVMRFLPKSGITWGDLMFKESCAIISAMESLRDSYNIPAYSMHDGLIVPLSARDIAEKEVVQAFARFGIECRVKVEV